MAKTLSELHLIYRLKHTFSKNIQSSAILVCALPLLNNLTMGFGIHIHLSNCILI